MKRIIIVLFGIMLIGLFGCKQQKYKLELDGYGFSSKKSTYKEGETVKVIYDFIATDTDYFFYLDCDDTKLDIHSNDGVFVITFKMPRHNVKLSKSSRNTMVYIPAITITLKNQVKTADIWITEDTLEKRKQSVWSGTTVKACATDDSYMITLESVSEDDLYIIRMIDTDQLYYEAYNVEITDGASVIIRLKENDFGVSVYVYNNEENLVKEYEMFIAAL